MRVHFNRLEPDQDERLALLLEEMGEAIQVIGKIQRHGYLSQDPTKGPSSPTNRELLEKELGDVLQAAALLIRARDGDLSVCYQCGCIAEFAGKPLALRVVKEKRLAEPQFAALVAERARIRKLRGMPE